MNFAFTDEQRALAATARDLFAKESPPSRLRSVWDGAELDPGVWKTMAGVGLTGITVAAEHGGMGGDEIDLALVLEEVGRAALPEPLAEVAAAARLVGDPALSRAIAAGDVLVIGTDGPFVPEADRAALVIVGDVAHRSFNAERVASVDHGRRLFRVTPTDAGEHVPGARSRATWARGSVLNGVSMRLLEMTVAHATERRQFGVPIGSFQAVKHMLASVHTRIVAARAAAHYAAYALARDLPEARHATDVAFTAACAAHSLADREALQVHAGIGFTWEHDLHLWLKRGLALATGAGEHRARLAARLFEEAPDA